MLGVWWPVIVPPAQNRGMWLCCCVILLHCLQAAHLLAELQDKARQGVQPAPASSVIAAGAGPAASAPADGGPASEPSLAVMLGLRLACRGYGVVLRTCFPSLDSPGQQEAGVEGKQQAAPELMVVGLRHTFVRVSQPVPAEEAVVLPTVIVDPVFRESFEMPHPTPRWVFRLGMSTVDKLR